MRKLMNLVDELEKENDMEKQVELLRRINAKILTEHFFKLANIGAILPLKIEAFLYKEKVFEDKFIGCVNGVYGAGRRNNFGSFYIRPDNSGVEIVLSRNDQYAFSILLKNASVSLFRTGMYAPCMDQQQLCEFLREIEFPLYLDVLRCMEPTKEPVLETVRNDLSLVTPRSDFPVSEQETFRTMPLDAFVPSKYSSTEYEFEPGYSMEQSVVNYLKQYRRLHPKASVKKLKQFCNELLPGTEDALLDKVLSE